MYPIVIYFKYLWVQSTRWKNLFWELQGHRIRFVFQFGAKHRIVVSRDQNFIRFRYYFVCHILVENCNIRREGSKMVWNAMYKISITWSLSVTESVSSAVSPCEIFFSRTSKFIFLDGSENIKKFSTDFFPQGSLILDRCDLGISFSKLKYSRKYKLKKTLKNWTYCILEISFFASKCCSNQEGNNFFAIRPRSTVELGVQPSDSKKKRETKKTY